MIRNILDYLEQSALKYGNKPAFVDEEHTLTFSQLQETARRIGSALIGLSGRKRPVPVFMGKSADEIAAFLGVVYSGNSYAPVDPQMPVKRVEKILDTLQADLVLADEECKSILEKTDYRGKVFLFQNLAENSVDETGLQKIRRTAIDTDLLYVIFTSGSTGVPKGAALSHRAVIDFTEWFSTAAKFDDTSVFGNQAPFYFDMSVKDIYSTLRNGATTYIIPKKMFNFPRELFRYINENHINTLAWATSAVCLAAKESAFEKECPSSVRAVCFGGEAMPVHLLEIWRRYVPDALYMNMYGPTETAVDCTYYILPRDQDLSDAKGYLPAGYPCENVDILILNGDSPAKEGETGEICVRGTALAQGYYNDPAKTAGVFVQNPLQTAYPEMIYRTGDMGFFNERGEIMFASRKDDQIKHMGYRIELGEIEAALDDIKGIDRCCCLFDKPADRIICIYTGEASRKEIILELSSYVPKYMWPNKFVQLEEMPLNMNGKIDRSMLREKYIDKQDQKL